MNIPITCCLFPCCRLLVDVDCCYFGGCALQGGALPAAAGAAADDDEADVEGAVALDFAAVS